MRTRPNFFAFLLLAALVMPAGLSAAEDAAVLQEAGLTQEKNVYVTAAEAELVAARQDITKTLRDHKKAEDGFKKDQRKIDKAKKSLSDMQREIDRLGKLINEADNHHVQDRYLPKYNELKKTRDEGKKELEAYEPKHEKESAAARAAFIKKLYAWVEQAKVVTEQYKTLAEDEGVASAIEAASEQGNAKYTLGPSTTCKKVQGDLGKAMKTYRPGAAALRKDGKGLVTDVVINGKPAIAMQLKPQDKYTMFPASLAKELGIKIKGKSPTVQVKAKRGNRIVDFKLVTLDSVQVGEHEIKDVKVLVGPEGEEGVPAVLGRMFFDHFAYAIDAEQERLILGPLK